MIKNRKGYTLIELLTVLTLLSIFLGPLLNVFMNVSKLIYKTIDYSELRNEAICMSVFVTNRLEKTKEIAIGENYYLLKGSNESYRFRIHRNKCYVTEGNDFRNQDVLYTDHMKELNIKREVYGWSYKIILKKGSVKYEIKKRIYID